MHGRGLDEPFLADLSTELDRRTLLTRALALAAGVLPAASLLAACGDGDGMMGGMPDWMMSGRQMMEPRMMDDVRVIRELGWPDDWFGALGTSVWVQRDSVCHRWSVWYARTPKAGTDSGGDEGFGFAGVREPRPLPGGIGGGEALEIGLADH
jgi:hypothetical protein